MIKVDKKREILEEAFELFCEKGYHLSMSELAGKVEIKTPSLYSHFNGKDQILSIMIEEEIHRFYGSLQEKMIDAEKMGCKEAMRSIYNFVMTYFAENNRLRFWRWIPFIANGQLRTASNNLITQKDSEFYRAMRSCFLRGQERGEIRRDAAYSSLQLYFCTIQGALDGMLLYERSHEAAYLDNIFEAYWQGVYVESEDRKGSM